MTTTVILAACAYRLYLLSGHSLCLTQHNRTISIIQLRWATAIIIVLAAWMVAESIGPALGAPAWNRYQRASAAAIKAERIAISDARQRTELKAIDRQAALELMKRELETVLASNPQEALAHVRLAAVKLQLFELLQQEASNPMPLAALRDAAFQSRFSSRAELDKWLVRAIGSHYCLLDQSRLHARQALALCPLLGEAYVYLKELSFLEGVNPATKAIYLAQALRVRPFDGEVHFEAGKEYFLDGKPEEAIKHWRQSYHSSEEYKLRLINLFSSELATQLPISFFLEKFEPDLDGLRQLRLRYRNLELPDQWQALLNYSVTKITECAKSKLGTDACNLWLEAESLCRDLGNSEQQIECRIAALKADANNYAGRHAAVLCFYKAQQLENVEEHVKWCLTRAPNDKDLKRIRDEIVRARLKSSPHASLPSKQTNTMQ